LSVGLKLGSLRRAHTVSQLFLFYIVPLFI
jgi:hypothetical protein